MDELLMERYALAKERVCEIKEEKAVQMPYLDFFQKTAAFLEKCGNYGWRCILGEAGNQGNLQMRLIYL